MAPLRSEHCSSFYPLPSLFVPGVKEIGSQLRLMATRLFLLLPLFPGHPRSDLGRCDMPVREGREGQRRVWDGP